MSDAADRAEREPSGELSGDEAEAVAERKAESARVVHEAVRLQGVEELARPALSLIFSGLAAGVAICTSVVAESALKRDLPEAPWADLVIALGYPVGYVIAVLGGLQLFTESTVTAVLPVASRPSRVNLGRLLRLWVLVFAANMVGTLIVAAMMANGLALTPDLRAAALALADSHLRHGFMETLLLGLPAGFLVGAIAWILPNARGSEFWVVVAITYVVAIGGFAHVIAGSCEAWLLMFAGERGAGAAVGGFILPALLGNIAGGTGLFAVLAHGQVRQELDPED